MEKYDSDRLYVGCVVVSAKRGWVHEAGLAVDSTRLAAPHEENAWCLTDASPWREDDRDGSDVAGHLANTTAEGAEC